MIRQSLFIGLILVLSVWLSTRAVNGVANWYQKVVDNAYNKGRTVERVCSGNDLPDVCEKHNADTGHSEFSSTVPAR